MGEKHECKKEGFCCYIERFNAVEFSDVDIKPIYELSDCYWMFTRSREDDLTRPYDWLTYESKYIYGGCLYLLTKKSDVNRIKSDLLKNAGKCLFFN